MASNFSILLI